MGHYLLLGIIALIGLSPMVLVIVVEVVNTWEETAGLDKSRRLRMVAWKVLILPISVVSRTMESRTRGSGDPMLAMFIGLGTTWAIIRWIGRHWH